MNFEVLINCSFLDVNDNQDESLIKNKHVLSIINDFEDGKWRSSKFHNFIWDNIAETGLSYKERESLVSQSQSQLVESAKNLRLTDKLKDISKGSELAEILLYGIMKHHYGALPVVPKIFYKQNSQDNAKGADSVHIVIEDNNDFSIWFGEAKFYNSIEDARLNKIIDSVSESLRTDKLKKENSIITNVCDIDEFSISEKLKITIKEALDNKESIDSLKSRINIPILILHECGITNTIKELTQEYKDNIIKYHRERANSYFKKQIKKLGSIFKYSDIKFHIILFPIPQKEPIINKFISTVEFYKEQSKND